MVSDLLTKHEGGSEETMHAIRDLAGSFYAGGSDTVRTASVISLSQCLRDTISTERIHHHDIC